MIANVGDLKQAWTEAKATKWHSLKNCAGAEMARFQVQGDELCLIASDGEYRCAMLRIPLSQIDNQSFDYAISYKAMDKIMGNVAKADYDRDVVITAVEETVEYETAGTYTNNYKDKETLTRIDSTITMSIDGIDYVIPCNEIDNTLNLFDHNGDTTYEMSMQIGDLRTALTQVNASICTDETRPILCGVHFAWDEDGFCRMVTTDTYRLTYTDMPITSDHDAPEKGVVIAMGTLVGMMALTKQYDDNEIITMTILYGLVAQFTIGGNRAICGRLVEGQYVNYMRVMGCEVYSDEMLFTFAFAGKAKDVSKRLTKIGKVGDDGYRLIYTFTKGSDVVHVASYGEFIGMNNQQAVTTCNVELVAPAEHDIVLAYNWQYITDVIDRAGDEAPFKTVINTKRGEGMRSLFCSGNNSEFAVMPMQPIPNA